jgi:hypothetical protein
VIVRGSGWEETVRHVVVVPERVVWTSEVHPAISGPTELIVASGPLPYAKDLLLVVDVSSLPHASIVAEMFSGYWALERLVLPVAIKRIPSLLCFECFRLVDVNFDTLREVASIDVLAFGNCLSLRKFVVPRALRTFGSSALAWTRISELDLGENAMVDVDLSDLHCLEKAILPRAMGSIRFESCSSLGSLTIGRARSTPQDYWPGHLLELRFTRLDGRLPEEVGACLSGVRVFSELSAVAGRESRPALLP